MIKNQTDWPALFRIGFEKRNADELYHIKTDPYCLHDLSQLPKMKPVLRKLKAELERKLTEQGDPRMIGNGDIFDSYPRFAPMRPLEGFKEQGKYNPKFMKK